jgi:hypothetical protein
MTHLNRIPVCIGPDDRYVVQLDVVPLGKNPIAWLRVPLEWVGVRNQPTTLRHVQADGSTLVWQLSAIVVEVIPAPKRPKVGS